MRVNSLAAIALVGALLIVSPARVSGVSRLDLSGIFTAKQIPDLPVELDPKRQEFVSRGIKGIIWDKIYNDLNTVYVSTATQNRKNVFVKCNSKNELATKELEVFTRLKGVGAELQSVPGLANSQRHVVQMLDYFTTGNTHCFVLTNGGKYTLLNYLEEMDLSKRVNFLPQILDQVIEGAAYLHLAGVIHRDLHLGNLLISGSGKFSKPWVTIIDFDHAQLVDKPNWSPAQMNTRSLDQFIANAKSVYGQSVRGELWYDPFRIGYVFKKSFTYKLSPKVELEQAMQSPAFSPVQRQTLVDYQAKLVKLLNSFN